MILNNIVYGIPGFIAVIGMLSIYIGVALSLKQENNLLKNTNQNNYENIIPSWNKYIIQIFIGSIYFYAGVAKLDPDWLSGSTIRELFLSWIGPTAIYSFLEYGFENHWIFSFIAYSGMLFDILVPFGLMIPISFIQIPFAFSSLIFHIFNHFTFVIETFPWVMIASLSIYFNDSTWIDILYNQINKLYQLFYPSIKYIYIIFHQIIKYSSLFLLISIFITMILIPLPCAIYTILGNEINFNSQCQFFSWRMMTRTSKLFTFILYLKNPKTNDIDPLLLTQFNLPQDEISCISMYEDYLYETVQQIKSKAQASTNLIEFVPPIITADIWLQINGPPIQRYVNPSIDLSIQLLKPSYSIFNISNYFSLFQYKTSNYPWVEERISEYRTNYWKEIYYNITEYEIQKYIHSKTNLTTKLISSDERKNISNQILFFSDRSGSERILTFYAQDPTILRLLSGQLFIKNYGLISSNQCLVVTGYLHISIPISSQSSLWMIRDIQKSLVILPTISSPNQKKYNPLQVHRNYFCSINNPSSLPSETIEQNFKPNEKKIKRKIKKNKEF